MFKMAKSRLEILQEKADALEAKLTEAKETKKPAEYGTPHVTTGPVGKLSTPFCLSRAVAAIKSGDTASAKEDLNCLDLYRKCLDETGSMITGNSLDGKSFLIPLSHDLIPERAKEHKSWAEFEGRYNAGTVYDPDEVKWLVKKSGFAQYKKTLSYLQDSLGGELVAPPVQGELIELMRPKEAMLNAGATVVPLPPQGKIVYPAQTGASTAYWVGENTSITPSDPTFGQVTLQSKKLATFVVMPNELLKYATPAADALIRTDTAKSLALAFDYAVLYGTGGAAQPLGLASYTGTNQLIQYAGVTPAPKGVGTNGNTLRPEDGYRIIGLIEDRNFEFSGWVTRPSLANNIAGYRADAVTPADAAGAFAQSMMRAVNDRLPMDQWVGYKMTKSSVIPINLTKGNATNLTDLWGGQWEHMLLGMYGAVEIAASNQAGNTFQQDQTAIRSILFCDSVPRYPAAFARYTSLINAPNS